MPSLSAPSAPWWVRSFGRLYLTVYGHRDELEARRHAPAILRALGVPPHARVLDVGCGEGRYCRAFADLGHRPTGVDLSRELLDEARRLSPDLPGKPTYVQGDMRALPFFEQFDAAVSLFTSLGYFETAEEDVAVMRGVRRALVPGGRFLVDFLNAPQVRSGLVAASQEDRPFHRLLVRRRVETVPAGPFVVKEVTVEDRRTGRIAGEFEERVRLYEPDELDALLARAGLDPVGDRTGDLDGGAWSPQSPRCVRVAARPRAAA